jgi:tetratricopeptide (TPR) repeat protein
MNTANIEKIIEDAVNAFHNNRASDAFKTLNQSLLADPGNTGVLNALGDLYYLSNNMMKAHDLWGQSLAINPRQVDILFNIALIHSQNNAYTKALEAYNNLLAINPNDVDSLNNRGNIFLKLFMYDEAVEDYKSALEKGFNTFETFYNLANCLYELGLYKDAIHFFNISATLNPTAPEIYNNMWLIYRYTDVSKARDCLMHALKIKPDYDEAQYNLAIFYLSIGEYEEGWQAYENRYKLKQFNFYKDKYQLNILREHSPPWIGKCDVKGKVLYIYPEQGFGDFIQFCRYLPILESMGAIIWLEIPNPLKSITISLDCKFKLVENIESGFDYHCPIMSLPLALKTNIKNIPAPKKYLHAETEKINAWGEKLGTKKRFRIGLVWQGGFHRNDPRAWIINRRRNININLLKELLTQDIEIFSLQKGADAVKELEIFKKENTHITIHDHSDMLLDFSDTAALIENLDLVITVDTAVAHLAGSLGKETWILNRFDTCWRWFSDHRTSSPWYPSVRVFTQKEPGEWEDIVSELVQEVKKYIQK